MKMRITVWRSFLWMVFLITLASSKENLKCPVEMRNDNCSCLAESTNSFTIQCGDANMFVSVIDSSSNAVEIRCDQNTHTSLNLYEQLPVLIRSRNNIFGFSFMNCPLPDVPLNIVMGEKGNVEVLKFRSNMAVNQNLTYHLDGLDRVTELNLQHNGLNYMRDNIFGHMMNLTKLDLSFNNIKLERNLFESLSMLRTLDLSENKITKLPEKIFLKMSSLQILNLTNNNMKEIMPGTFDDLNQMAYLDLSYNILNTLPSQIFNKLANLHILSIRNNNFSGLPDGLFVDNKDLKSVLFESNQSPLSKLPRYFLANLSQIVEINLFSIKLKVVPEYLFENSTALKKISLRSNMIENIPSNLFVHQRKLRNLDISFNRIKSLPDGVFDNLYNLQVLNLDSNGIQHLQSEILRDLIQLREFSIRNNQISTIADESFSTLINLIKIDISHNLLKFNNFLPSPFNKCLQVEHLDLCYNNLTTINFDWRISFVKLKKLNLSHNFLTVIRYEDMKFNSGFYLEVDLRCNKIAEITVEVALRKESSKKMRSEIIQLNSHYESHIRSQTVTNVLIEHNPITCGCVLHEFMIYLKGELNNEEGSEMDMIVGDLKYENPSNLEGKLISNLHLKELVWPLDNPLSHSGNICPKHCECFVRFENSAFIANCSGHIDVPDFSSIHGEVGWMNQTELHLEENQITSFDKLYLETVNRNVTRLYLRNNNITKLDIARNIEVLDIRNNQLSMVDSKALELLRSSRIREIWLSENPISCNCSNEGFISYLQENHTKIADYLLLKCPDNSNVSSLELSHLCSSAPGSVAALVLSVAAVLAVGLVTGLFYKYGYEIKVYLYNKGWLLLWVTKEELYVNKIWDGYVSYSPEDEWFIHDELQGELEQKPPCFKLCLDFRDWIAGVFRPTEIRKSIENSKTTIVILSPNFLASVWNREELKQAHCEALKVGQKKVIAILLQDIGRLENLDTTFQSYLHDTFLLKYGEPRFWEKLRYELPHPPCPKNCSYYILSSITYVIALLRVILNHWYKNLSKNLSKSLSDDLTS